MTPGRTGSAVAALTALVMMLSTIDLRAAEVEILREWRGRVSDTQSPLPSFVTDNKTLAKVWRELNIPKKRPLVDFREHIVLVAVVRSSVVRMRPDLDATGNLTRRVVATPDQPPFKSFVVGLVSLAGVKTVEGKPLPR